MSERRIFLGVDGGGTKTEFVCIDEAGAVVGRHVEGTTYHLQVGLEGAVRALGDGIAGVCAQAGLTRGDLAFAFFGLPAFGEDAVIDPQLNAQVCAVLPRHARPSGRGGEALRYRTVIMAIERGPDALTDRQKRLVLTDPIALSELHAQVSTSPAAHPAWRAARTYAASAPAAKAS